MTEAQKNLFNEVMSEVNTLYYIFIHTLFLFFDLEVHSQKIILTI